MKSRNLIMLLVVAAAVAGVSACGSSSNGSGSTSNPTTTTGAATNPGAPNASVAFITPRAGSTSPSTVTAKVAIKQFKINAAAVGKAATQGEGHLHFSMDGGKFDTAKYSGANGQLAQKLGVAGMYSPSVTPTITYKGLPPGKHTLTVSLANNDHTPTGVEASVSFTVK